MKKSFGLFLALSILTLGWVACAPNQPSRTPTAAQNSGSAETATPTKAAEAEIQVPSWDPFARNPVPSGLLSPEPENKSDRLIAFASEQNEIIFLIKLAVLARRIDPEAVLERARQTREMTAQYVITDKDLTKLKNAGRK